MSADPGRALQLDHAIDALLAREGGPSLVEDDELLATARLVRTVLPAFHPGLGFEERLAQRLAHPVQPIAVDLAEPRPLRSVVAAAEGVGAAGRPRRARLAGGAIVSGAWLVIPILGAAVMAWRRARASGGIP